VNGKNKGTILQAGGNYKERALLLVLQGEPSNFLKTESIIPPDF